MSGKYTSRKKNTGKKRSSARNNRSILVLLLSLVAILIVLLFFAAYLENREEEEVPSQEILQEEPILTETGIPNVTQAPTEDRSDETQLSQPVKELDLGSGVIITDYLSYTGAFMEDRTDEVVTDVLAIKVTNTGEEYIQTMDITLNAGDIQAQFSLSTLFPGETVVALEKNRMAYSTAPEFEQVQIDSVALFDEYPGMCEDELEIQCLNGVINVTNISGEDITEDILIYYKNYVSEVYYGGITYRLRIEDGLKAGEIRQGMAAHFNPDNSAIVFVTCG